MPTIKKRGSASKRQQPEQEIQLLAHKLSDFAAANRKILSIILAALAAILILAAGYWLRLSLQEQKAAPLVASAYELYSPVTAASPDYAKALDLYREVQKKYPSTHSGAVAQFYIGNCLMGLGRNDEALKEYQAFAAKYTGDKFLLGLVYERMGYAAAALGKQDEAIKAFERSESLAGPGVSTMELAKLYEASGNMVESQKKYKLIADKLPGTSWAMEAMGKVQNISPTQTPVPPLKGSK